MIVIDCHTCGSWLHEEFIVVKTSNPPQQIMLDSNIFQQFFVSMLHVCHAETINPNLTMKVNSCSLDRTEFPIKIVEGQEPVISFILILCWTKTQNIWAVIQQLRNNDSCSPFIFFPPSPGYFDLKTQFVKTFSLER